MKILLSLLTIVAFLNPLSTEAKEETKNFHTVDQYISPNDMLIALISPQIDKIVNSKYKNKPAWNPGRIVNIETQGNANGKTWYNVEMLIYVGEPDSAKIDKIKMKVEVPNNNG